MNHISLIGRACADPTLKYTPNGIAVSNFNLAVNRDVKSKQGEQEVDFISIISWQKQAEAVANYLKKGRLVAVEGRLQIRNYEQDGQKRKAAEVVASRVQFLESAHNDKPPQQEPMKPHDDDISGIDLNDLPF
jgi:single-strand DNA-binding protein